LGLSAETTYFEGDNLQFAMHMQEIQHVLYRGLRCTDEKRWDEWATCFTDEQTIDFGSVKPPQTIKSRDLAAWARLAPHRRRALTVKDSERTAQFLTNVVGFKEVRGFSVNAEAGQVNCLFQPSPCILQIPKLMVVPAEHSFRIETVPPIISAR
jgi:hypothetical protein